MCTKKIIPTETKAETIRKNMELKHHNLFRHYFCEVCQGWHIAHRVPRGKMQQILSNMNREYTQ